MEQGSMCVSSRTCTYHSTSVLSLHLSLPKTHHLIPVLPTRGHNHGTDSRFPHFCINYSLIQLWETWLSTFLSINFSNFLYVINLPTMWTTSSTQLTAPDLASHLLCPVMSTSHVGLSAWPHHPSQQHPDPHANQLLIARPCWSQGNFQSDPCPHVHLLSPNGRRLWCSCVLATSRRPCVHDRHTGV